MTADVNLETNVRLFLTTLFAALLLGAAPAEPPIVRVKLTTSAGVILLAIDYRHAPKTAANFLRYVDDQRLDGTWFYRAARRKVPAGTGFVQGGIGTDARRRLDPVEFESTAKTGLRHVDGAISMARYEALNTATGNFSLLVGATPSMDARPGYPGYAVVGRVIGGMDVLRRILAQPTSPGGEGAFKGQMLLARVRIVSAQRLDGTAKVTPGVKIWQLFER